MKLKLREECLTCKHLIGTNPEDCLCKQHENPTCYRKKKFCQKHEELVKPTKSYPDSAIAYTDGSYNKETKHFGYGVVFLIGNEEMLISGQEPDINEGWQIQGEITAALKACEKAIELGCKTLEIRYDYEGVENWPTGRWKAKKAYTQEYAKVMSKYMEELNIKFRHVKAHTGEEGNTRVDELAKIACGVALPPKAMSGYVPNIPTDISEKCRNSILAFYKKNEHTFSDYAKLKTFGIDVYSNKSLTELEKYAADRKLNISINDMDRNKFASIIRWVWRGLTLEDARFKVDVDAQLFGQKK